MWVDAARDGSAASLGIALSLPLVECSSSSFLTLFELGRKKLSRVRLIDMVSSLEKMMLYHIGVFRESGSDARERLMFTTAKGGRR